MASLLRSLLLCSLLAAVMASGVLSGYEMTHLYQQEWGFTADLKRVSSGPYGGDVDILRLFAYFQSVDVLRVKIVDPNKSRWEVPDVVQQSSPPSKIPKSTSFKVSFTSSPFGMAVTRVANNGLIWNTTSPSQGTVFNGLIVRNPPSPSLLTLVIVRGPIH